MTDDLARIDAMLAQYDGEILPEIQGWCNAVEDVPACDVKRLATDLVQNLRAARELLASRDEEIARLTQINERRTAERDQHVRQVNEYVERIARLKAELKETSDVRNAYAASHSDTTADIEEGRVVNDPWPGKGSVPNREYCDDCDGCGWVEGGKTLKTRCEKCGGSGIIVSPLGVR